MKNWLGLIIVFVLFFGGGFMVGVGTGRALTNDILIESEAKYSQNYIRMKAKHAKEIIWREEQKESYAHLYRLFEQFKNHPFYPYNQ